MKTTLLIAGITLLFAAHPALALSTQSGDQLPANTANIADPDEKQPVHLGNGVPHDNFDDAPSGQGFISKDAVNQSIARGNGSYLPPDTK